MAPVKMFAHRLIRTVAYAAIGAMAVGAAYASGDAAYALGRFVGAG